MERSDLMRMSNVSKRAEFDEAIETLKEACAVLEYKVKGKTKPKTVYVYVPSPYAKLNFPPIETEGYEENGFFELTEKSIVKEITQAIRNILKLYNNCQDISAGSRDLEAANIKAKFPISQDEARLRLDHEIDEIEAGR